jgi:hypothetical protein
MWGLVGLLLLTPLAVGSVEPWAFAPMEAAAFLLAAVWMLSLLSGRTRASGLREVGGGMVLPLALLAGLVGFQLAPLPPALERIISPSTFELYQKSLPGWPEQPLYNAVVPVGGRSRNERILLPSSREVADGASIPFAATGKNLAAPDRGASTGNPIARWRSLSVCTSLTWTALLKVASYATIFFLVLLYPLDRYAQRIFARRLARAALLAGVVVAAIALLQRAFFNGKTLWFFVPYDWGKGDP